MTLDWGASTDTGLRRSINEDSYLAARPVFMVADGMGGHDTGDAASAATVAAFSPLVGRDTVTVDEVRAALVAARHSVSSLGAPNGGNAAGTTITGVAATTQGGTPYWIVVNLGDSRTYLFADGHLEQVSVDHSLVQELVDSGELDAASANGDPRRNVITRAIGAGSHGAADFWLIPASAGDRLLICSDGLTTELDDGKIAQALLEEQSPQEASTRLVHEALLHGGHDNVTVVVVDVVNVASIAVDANSESSEETMPRLPAALVEGSAS